jgi:hypothetical protein
MRRSAFGLKKLIVPDSAQIECRLRLVRRKFEGKRRHRFTLQLSSARRQPPADRCDGWGRGCRRFSCMGPILPFGFCLEFRASILGFPGDGLG